MADHSLVPSGNTRKIRMRQRQDGTVCFVARDVCSALNLGNVSESLSSLDVDEKLKITLRGDNGKHHVWAVTEIGLYALVFSSSKPVARAVQKFLINLLCHPRRFEWDELLSLMPIYTEYVKELKQKRAKHRHVRRSREFSSDGSFTQLDIKIQIKAQKGKCYYCGRRIGKSYTIDHVVPLSRGGSNTADNIVIACPSCNYSKNDRMPHEWPQGGRLL